MPSPAPQPGRPRVFPKGTVRVTATLPPDVVALLKRLGRGNVSAGIRRVVDERKK